MTKNNLNKLLYLIFFIFVATFSFFLHTNFGDDAHYTTILQNESLIEFTLRHYNTWSARSLVEAITVLVGSSNILIFKIINTITIYFLGVFILKLADIKDNPALIMIGLISVFSYTWIDLYSAGWLTTLTIMFWPLAIGIICLTPIVQELFYQKPISKKEYILSSLGMIYAANLETVSAFLLIVYLAFMGYSLFNKIKISTSLYTHIGIIIANLSYILLSPGNKARVEITISGFYLDFNMNSFFENVYNGVYRSLQSIFLDLNIFLVLLAFAIFISIVTKYKKGLERIIYTFFSGVLLVMVILLNHAFYKREIIDLFENNAGLNVSNMNSLIPYILFTFLCLLALLLILGIYVALGHNKKSFLAITIFLAGFASAVSLGLTPSIAVSGSRAYVVFEYSIIICFAIIVSDIYTKVSASVKKLVCIVSFLALYYSSYILIEGFLYPPYV